MGAAAKLPMDAIAVHAPAVLHLTFPAGTTLFRIDARADPVYAKNGSMQVLPFDHPPTSEQLHFDQLRWVFGAPKSWRQRSILGWSLAIKSSCSFWIGGDEALYFFDPLNLLPVDVRAFWGLRNALPIAESTIGDKFPSDLKFAPWFGNSLIFREYASPPMLANAERLAKQISATVEARDALLDVPRTW